MESVDRNEDLDLDATVEALATRAHTLQLLARALSYPTRAQSHELACEFARISERGWPWPLDPEATALLVASWQSHERDEIREEQVRLFCGDASCPPNESAWGDARRMSGRTHELADVAGFYAAFGLSFGEGAPQLPDHVAVELEFLSVLLLKLALAIHDDNEAGREVTESAWRDFLEHHAGRWIPVFCDKAARTTHNWALAHLVQTVAWVVLAECAFAGVRPSLVNDAEPVANDPEAMTCPMA